MFACGAVWRSLKQQKYDISAGRASSSPSRRTTTRKGSATHASGNSARIHRREGSLRASEESSAIRRFIQRLTLADLFCGCSRWSRKAKLLRHPPSYSPIPTDRFLAATATEVRRRPNSAGRRWIFPLHCGSNRNHGESPLQDANGRSVPQHIVNQANVMRIFSA